MNRFTVEWSAAFKVCAFSEYFLCHKLATGVTNNKHTGFVNFYLICSWSIFSPTLVNLCVCAVSIGLSALVKKFLGACSGAIPMGELFVEVTAVSVRCFVLIRSEQWSVFIRATATKRSPENLRVTANLIEPPHRAPQLACGTVQTAKRSLALPNRLCGTVCPVISALFENLRGYRI